MKAGQRIKNLHPLGLGEGFGKTAFVLRSRYDFLLFLAVRLTLGVIDYFIGVACLLVFYSFGKFIS
jgi:hypothetical protein